MSGIELLLSYTMDWQVITVFAAIIFAVGWHSWLLLHVAKEGAEIKKKVNTHGELHARQEEITKRVEQKVDNVGTVVNEVQSDLKGFIKETNERLITAAHSFAEQQQPRRRNTKIK